MFLSWILPVSEAGILLQNADCIAFLKISEVNMWEGKQCSNAYTALQFLFNFLWNIISVIFIKNNKQKARKINTTKFRNLCFSPFHSPNFELLCKERCTWLAEGYPVARMKLLGVVGRGGKALWHLVWVYLHTWTVAK